MTHVIGIVLIVMGVLQIALRRRTARAGAANNRVMFNGRMSGPGFMAYSQSVALIVGAVFIVFGFLMAIGVIATNK